MPRSVLPLLSRPAVWALPIALVLVGLFAFNTVDPLKFAGYWDATLASSGIFIILSSPICAVVSAIEGSRLRVGRGTQIQPTRSGTAIYWQRLWPSLALGAVLQAVAFLLAARASWGAPGIPNPWFFVAFMAVIAAHSALGLLLGRLVPLPIGIPVALLLSFGWLGFAWAVPFFPPRYMAGLSLSDCCRVQYAMDPRAVATTIVFNTAVFGVLFLCAASLATRLQRRTARRRAIASAAFVAIAVVVSLAIAAPLGPYPTQPRAASDSHCEGDSPTICLFPEQERTAGLRETITTAITALKKTGANVPSRVDAAATTSTATTLPIGVGITSTPPIIVTSLANGFLQPSRYAYCSDEKALQERQVASMTIVSWLVRHMATPETGVNPESVPGFKDGSGEITKVLQLPPAAQTAWVNKTLPALTDCSVPIDLP